ncbi:MAG TPA: hypothetical protein VF789_03575 [Thermoanaerobaculia bacterium]
MEIEHLEEALQLAGWLLAEQMDTVTRGEVPHPHVILSSEELEWPKLVKITTSSDSYEDLVSGGRDFFSDQASHARCRVFAYDADLDPAGRIVFLEVAWKGWSQPITFGQRYWPPTEEDDDFMLAGEVELLGRELLPSSVLEALESAQWRELVDRGAEDHPVAGEQWLAWNADRQAGPGCCSLKEFTFPVLPGWYPKPADFPGLMLFRLMPRSVGSIPAIALVSLDMEEELNAEGMAEHFKAKIAENDVDVISSDIFHVASLALTAGRILWVDSESGMNVVQVFIPRKDRSCFSLWATALPEFWADTLKGLDAVLASLQTR